MKHIEEIKMFLSVMMKSDQFHALIIKSPPGWAKSTTINAALEQLKMEWKSIGSYSTPLYFYNCLVHSPDKLLVLDDCAGLFDDAQAMAVLKACTWPATGSKNRIVAWGSTSKAVSAPAVSFKGKLVLLTNALPGGHDIEALKTRALFYDISFTREETLKMLREASTDKAYFKNQKLAKQVVNYLTDGLMKRDFSKFNLRTLSLGYELAAKEPKRWRASMEHLLPRKSHEAVVQELSSEGVNVEEQARLFTARTGLARRSFFVYRQKLGLSDPENMRLGVGLMRPRRKKGSIEREALNTKPKRIKHRFKKHSAHAAKGR